ncbi:Zinc transporter ZupT [Pseudodesulfovibrio profundus]|uniref:Zinc transporter ZupT n=1 Tax=Pseudodesulfovibrio profundus TaxID=57320 RepID=A0A2C8FB23_9BACT|nr:zinc transporter ZupT [Pseudodesulfovibrio profundus]MBC17686.1 zinc transporter ZupT [Desulfovibrio sp.]SOB59086.1 Zinc transporter ZupT [Pseudodesulfovibrio profundus]|tara:strand:- start:32266 stop:33099 length:834 start_codon:yes stop_codon:yes gene_type:complete
MMDNQAVLFAFGLTLFAGLCTGIGSAIAFFAQRTNTKFLSLALGFSAGVMVYVSFWEIVRKANDALTLELGDVTAQWVTVLSFFGGMALIAIIDKFVPSYENPHEMHSIEEMDVGKANLPKDETHDFDKLKRMGIFAAIAIAIHNFPEGLATFTAAMSDPSLGIAIAVAVAIHNIPEGIAVSIPLYYATGSKKKAFLYSFLSGISEPIGALVGFLLLMPFFTPVVFGVLFAGVGGIMVFISFDQLLPAAEEYGEHHHSIYGLISGMVVMALSLLLFL